MQHSSEFALLLVHLPLETTGLGWKNGRSGPNFPNWVGNRIIENRSPDPAGNRFCCANRQKYRTWLEKSPDLAGRMSGPGWKLSRSWLEGASAPGWNEARTWLEILPDLAGNYWARSDSFISGSAFPKFLSCFTDLLIYSTITQI